MKNAEDGSHTLLFLSAFFCCVHNQASRTEANTLLCLKMPSVELDAAKILYFF